ncbi:Olfactomedin-4 [Dissostichus eleginoides]|uniref:Olfactomedin-4 n=1 Tax=Dissostichus eleginoides TaxID=100907 RepID=A0AAD9C253_DISEL|nr:Olfactomedin-4 [Dissostichus eleginoides]
MIGTLYFLALLSSAMAWGRLGLLSEGSAKNGTGGGSGDRCTCDAFLPSSTFPIKDLVVVEQTAVEISHKLELEMGKLEDYEIKLTAYAERIIELSAPTLSLSLCVYKSQLELTYDKNLVLMTRREYIKVQLQLEECERRHQELFNPNIGSCAHTGIIKVSKPVVSQLNANLNAGYKYGGWGKDSKPVPDRESMYWYRINNPFGLAKLNFTTGKYESKVIPRASSRFSYTNSPNQNFDFAADESGLWVTYANEESAGRMVIAKINEPSFGVEEEWQTSVYKPGVSNAFMVCGVLYAVKTVDIKTEEIFYKYDTKTKQESYVSVPFERFQDKYSNLDFNPTDQKLYMYNDGYHVNYHLWFNYTKATVEPPLLLS